MSRKNGRGTHDSQILLGRLASMFLALAFLTGCGLTPATVTPTPITTVSATSPVSSRTR